MSLADELLADLEDGEDTEDVLPLMTSSVRTNDALIDVKSSDILMEIDDQNNQLGYDSVRSLAKLIDSEELIRVMNEIKLKQTNGSEVKAFLKCQMDGPLEANPQYKLIVDANNMAVEIDNDINIIHKFVRDKYAKRFPELESLVPTALEYVMTVKELGNDLNKAKTNEKLQEFLTQATIMVVSVTASTTQGVILNDEELFHIYEACDIAIQLNNYKQNIYEFVESRMSFIAPNLSGV
jgi:U4/U6 small nuclear ribonucleoprotein PRP31